MVCALAIVLSAGTAGVSAGPLGHGLVKIEEVAQLLFAHSRLREDSLDRLLQSLQCLCEALLPPGSRRDVEANRLPMPFDGQHLVTGQVLRGVVSKLPHTHSFHDTLLVCDHMCPYHSTGTARASCTASPGHVADQGTVCIPCAWHHRS